MLKRYALAAFLGAAAFSVAIFSTYRALAAREAKGYAQGYAAATADAESLVRGIEDSFDSLHLEATAKVLEAQEAKHEALVQLSAAIDDLDRLRGAQRKSTSTTKVKTSEQAGNEESADWIGGFATCYSRYGAFATDAASWADSVNELQGWVNNVCRLGLCTEQFINGPTAAQSN